MKSAQILDIKATVHDHVNVIAVLKQQIETQKAEKATLQRDIQQVQQGWEDSKNSLRVSGKSRVKQWANPPAFTPDITIFFSFFLTLLAY